MELIITGSNMKQSKSKKMTWMSKDLKIQKQTGEESELWTITDTKTNKFWALNASESYMRERYEENV